MKFTPRSLQEVLNLTRQVFLAVEHSSELCTYEADEPSDLMGTRTGSPAKRVQVAHTPGGRSLILHASRLEVVNSEEDFDILTAHRDMSSLAVKVKKDVFLRKARVIYSHSVDHLGSFNHLSLEVWAALQKGDSRVRAHVFRGDKDVSVDLMYHQGGCTRVMFDLQGALVQPARWSKAFQMVTYHRRLPTAGIKAASALARSTSYEMLSDYR